MTEHSLFSGRKIAVFVHEKQKNISNKGYWTTLITQGGLTVTVMHPVLNDQVTKMSSVLTVNTRQS